jgi:hypothetical protein
VNRPLVPRQVRWFRSAGRRRALALATSLAVHAVAVILLLGQRPPPEPVVDVEPIAVEFIDSSPAPVVEPRAPQAPVPPEPSPRRRSARREVAGAEPETPSTAGSPGTRAADATPEPGVTLDMRMPPTSLALDYDAIDRLTSEGVLDRPHFPLGLPPKRPRGPSFSERLAARVRDDQARNNVEVGKVHPQIYDYKRGAERLFKPDMDIVYRDPRAPNTVGRSVRQWVDGGAEAFKSAGRSLFEDAPDVLSGYTRLQEGTMSAAQPMACLICLVVRPGESPRVELASSSGNKEVDRAAVDALTRTANRRPTDPDVRQQRSCYRFSVKIIRIPPVPMVGCGFDESTLSASCYYPTKKVVRTDVTLESVDYDG